MPYGQMVIYFIKIWPLFNEHKSFEKMSLLWHYISEPYLWLTRSWWKPSRPHRMAIQSISMSINTFLIIVSEKWNISSKRAPQSAETRMNKLDVSIQLCYWAFRRCFAISTLVQTVLSFVLIYLFVAFTVIFVIYDVLHG